MFVLKVKLSLSSALAGMLLLSGCAQEPVSVDNPGPVAAHWPVLERYCYDCHNDLDRAGDLALDRLHPDNVAADAATWELVLREYQNRSVKWPLAAQQQGLALLSACPPCQGMSSARSDLGKASDPDAGSKDARTLLVLVICTLAHALRPKVVTVENVPQFVTRLVRHPDTGEALSAAWLLCRELDAAGYQPYPIITDLADFGIPQSRRRAFITFVRRDLPAYDLLHRSGRIPYPLPECAPDHGGEPITVQIALEELNLPPLSAKSPASASVDGYEGLHAVPVWKSRQLDMIAAIPPRSGSSAWENQICEGGCRVTAGAEDVFCASCGMQLLRPVVVDNDGPRLVKGFRNSSYRRMRHDAPASTVTTASGRVGSDNTIHPWEDRVLSPWECQMLQTFPSSFNWGDTLNTWGVTGIREMIGEAVPPKFTELHGRLLATLLEDPMSMNAEDLLPASDERHVRAVQKLSRRP